MFSYTFLSVINYNCKDTINSIIKTLVDFEWIIAAVVIHRCRPVGNEDGVGGGTFNVAVVNQPVCRRDILRLKKRILERE